MLLATIGLLNPALGRLAAPLATNLLGFMALAAVLTDLFLLAVVFRDLQTRGHVSRAVLWGGLTVLRGAVCARAERHVRVVGVR